MLQLLNQQYLFGSTAFLSASLFTSQTPGFRQRREPSQHEMALLIQVLLDVVQFRWTRYF